MEFQTAEECVAAALLSFGLSAPFSSLALEGYRESGGSSSLEGEWLGYYRLPLAFPRDVAMRVFITDEQGRVGGEGHDLFGPCNVLGTRDGDLVSWRQTYGPAPPLVFIGEKLKPKPKIMFFEGIRVGNAMVGMWQPGGAFHGFFILVRPESIPAASAERVRRESQRRTYFTPTWLLFPAILGWLLVTLSSYTLLLLSAAAFVFPCLLVAIWTSRRDVAARASIADFVLSWSKLRRLSSRIEIAEAQRRISLEAARKESSDEEKRAQKRGA